MLFNGEEVGDGSSDLTIDIAVDPLECTDFCARAPWGTDHHRLRGGGNDVVARAGPVHGEARRRRPGGKEAIDLDDPPDRTVAHVAEALGKPVEELRVVVLDKPRHADLIEQLRGLGAAVSTPSDGDVGEPGGAPLGRRRRPLDGRRRDARGCDDRARSRALGGGMKGRLAPQSDDEKQAWPMRGWRPSAHWTWTRSWAGRPSSPPPGSLGDRSCASRGTRRRDDDRVHRHRPREGAADRRGGRRAAVGASLQRRGRRRSVVSPVARPRSHPPRGAP